MKVIILNTSERTGGAAVAAGRLGKALKRAGIQVDKIVRDNTWLNRFRFYWERLFIFLCNHLNRKNLFAVSIANTGTDVSTHPGDNSQIAELYSAADVTVVPSFYETFGQTIIEAMACGCPAVSFNNSGQTDIIDHKLNGYVANYKDANDLANGIRWVLDNRDPQALSEACVKKVRECYTEEVVAGEYVALYEKLLQRE